MTLRSIALGFTIATLCGLADVARGDVYYVDISHTNASDAGPGTETAPFKTIGGATSAHHDPGVTILVKPGIYDENIKPYYGQPLKPFTVRALPGAPVVVRGFYNTGRSWVVVDGFTMQNRIIIGYAHHVSVINCHVGGAGGFYGIEVSNCSELRIAANVIEGYGKNGIVFQDVTNTVVENNDIFNNYNGISVFEGQYGKSTGNIIRGNRIHDNADDGIYMAYCSAYPINLSARNLLWGNKHGVHYNSGVGAHHHGDVIWANTDDGIWLGPRTTAASFHNCIVGNNGRGRSSAYNLFADSTALPGLVSDDNIFWNVTGKPSIKVGRAVFPSLPAWTSAAGCDGRSIAEDPRFVDAENYDFRLTQRSPAIDCANSSVMGWLDGDAEGRAPADDPRIPNTGLGPIRFADRGALEFEPSTLDVDETAGSAAIVERVTVSPNPMRSVSQIEFNLVSAGLARLTIVDVQGRAIARLVDRDLEPGRQVATWDGRLVHGTAAPGLYFARLETPLGVAEKRFTLVR